VSRNDLFIGLDIGSATVKIVGINRDGQMVGAPVYLRHDAFANHSEAVAHAMRTYLESAPGRISGVGVTGSGRKLIGSLVGADLVQTEIFAHATGVMHLARIGAIRDDDGEPLAQVRSVIEIGGQDSKLIVLDEQGLPIHFSMNTICSAGTGEFLKQLADEASVTLEDFGGVALHSTHPANIDATCTVFSKRDFRHLTQKGVHLADRLMGVCEALARNYVKTVMRGYALPRPIVFQGGVALNSAVRQAFEKVLNTRLVITPHSGVVGALGMAVAVLESMGSGTARQSRFQAGFCEQQPKTRLRYCHGCQNACDLVQTLEERHGEVVVLATLGGRCDGCHNPRHVQDQPMQTHTLRIPVGREQAVAGPVRLWSRPSRNSEGLYFAGIDGGSRGTKYALIRSTGTETEIVTAGNVDTGGDAVHACRKALCYLKQALPAATSLAAIATTGSAGELFRDMITVRTEKTADARPTEILSHYAWASHWMPRVATVIDIGGNDNKLIAVSGNGLSFAMNDKCAAGTGAFLETVARRFGVPIDAYAEVALQSHNPARIAGRCAVFGESDIIHKARLGFSAPDLLLGVAFAVCRTYLADVGRGMLRLPIVAQGGAFLNAAVQHAFRETLGLGAQEFVVSENSHDVLCAGALGAALIARGRWEQGYDSHFKGFERVLTSKYHTVTTTCTHNACSRRCNGVVVLLEDGVPIAGYKAIDCPHGFFSGMLVNHRQRSHVTRLLAEAKGQVG
jgi:predicted CoA-substrate-specific enzyme activase